MSATADSTTDHNTAPDISQAILRRAYSGSLTKDDVIEVIKFVAQGMSYISTELGMDEFIIPTPSGTVEVMTLLDTIWEHHLPALV